MDGDFNANLAVPEGAERDEEITTALVAAGLEDMSAQFCLLRHPWTRQADMENVLDGEVCVVPYRLHHG